MHPDHMKLLKRARGLERQGDHPSATAAYQRLLGQAPRHAEVWSEFAAQLLALGQFKEAQVACETALAIDPQKPALHLNLGTALLRQGLLTEAEAQLRTAVATDPRNLEARLFLAECLLNKWDLISIRKVLDEADQLGAMGWKHPTLKAHHAQLWAIFSTELFEAEKIEAAEQACHAALRIDPHNFLAKSNLGSIRMTQGQLEEAEGLFRHLASDHPTDETPRLLLISCLTRKGDISGLDDELQQVIEQAPNKVSVHKSAIGTYYNLGRWPEFRAEIERYRKIDPGTAYLDFEQSLQDLLFGNMPQGWDRYEARLKVAQELRLKERTYAQPAWRGESFVGKTLLLWSEQGLGDTLMFIRYLPLVKALGGQVVLETWPALAAVAATCEGADRVVRSHAACPPFDLQASLLSLPSIFRTDLASIPANVPYLTVPDAVPHCQELLDQLMLAAGRTRVGLVWAGRPGHVRDFERSLPASALAPLATLHDVAWFSFQLGQRGVPPLPDLISLAPFLNNFSDTAYALSGMDLLITVDTAVAHLAGAMGVPTLLLLSFQPDFRWLLGRDDSPWYPSVRLYRQPAYGDWESVIRQVVTDLRAEA